MKLLLMRHAEAESLEAARCTYDAERHLNGEGRTQALLVAARLKAMQLRPQAVITGPFLRSKETAEIVAASLGCGVRCETLLMPGVGAEDFLNLLCDMEPGAGAEDAVLMSILHEPDVSAILHALLGSTSLPFSVCQADVFGLNLLRVDGVYKARIFLLYSPAVESLA